MPSTWLTVITPVPPMPERRTVKASAGTSGTGVGQPGAGVAASRRPSAAPAWRASASTVTVANAGQSPCRHDMSKLQLVWWMRVLRPYAVSTGCTDRQLLLSPQSPQPSHTRSLMTTRKSGLATTPAAAVAPQLGGAALVVDQHGHAGDVGQLDLALHQPGAVAHLDAAVGERAEVGVVPLARVVGRHDDPR